MINFLKQFLYYFTFVTILICFSSIAHSRQFVDKEHLVIDLLSNVEWMKCSTGQQWDGETCIGQIIRLDRSQIKQAIKQANEQLGGSWRLPSKGELEGILCAKCKTVKIDINFFPQTPAEPFWTSDKNYWSDFHFWSVNFFTGYSFSRFTEDKPLATRFVRDR